MSLARRNGDVSGHIVVDGSNIATEGRQTPSLAQLEGALEELRRDGITKLPGE